jgi:hypothetical protein
MIPIIDDQTPKLGLPLPHPDNRLADDVLRLRLLALAIDALVAALQTDTASKAGQDALDAASEAIAQLLKRADALEASRVKSVNGITGVTIALRPEDLALGPANGPGTASIAYDTEGRVTQVTEHVGDASATTTIGYTAAGLVAQTQTLYRGALRTVNYSYDAGGALTGYTATEVKA